MKRILRHALCCLFVLSAAIAAASEPQFRSPLARMELKDGDCVVFLGDSITHQCLYTQYVEDFFYTRFPKMRVRFHNAGVGGAKAWDALERFDRDVAAYKPKYVTVLLGMNDGRYQPFDQETFDTYHRDMTTLVGRLREIGATPVLMTPTMYDSRAARMGKREATPERLDFYNSVLAYFGTWLREVAVNEGYGFVDMWSPLNNLTLAERKTEPNFTLIRDAVHPDPPGQLVMADALLDDMGLRGPLSNVRILLSADGMPQVQATGGTVSELKALDLGVEFTWLADGLPFVVPPEAQLGAKLLRLGHRMSREALEIHGLPPGTYEVQIDGEAIGVFRHDALARHIELQDNAKTPQHLQALQVAELNKQRNAGPVRQLRGEWSRFQNFARLRAQVKQTPFNLQAKTQFDELEKQMEGMEDRIAEHEKAARELEDQIFAVNQPKPRRYVVRRVAPAEVSGTVILDGQPLAGAVILFRMESGVVARGVTDANGRYTLRSAGQPGAVPGAYRVTIQADEIPDKYADADQTALTAEVVDKANQFDFQLVRQR